MGIGSLSYAASRPTVSAPVKPPVKSAALSCGKTNKNGINTCNHQAIAGVNPTAVPISVVNIPNGADDDNLTDDGADDGGEVDITSTTPMVTNPATQPIAPASGQIQQVALGQYHPSRLKNLSK